MRNTRNFATAVAGLLVASAVSTGLPADAADPFFMGLGDLPGGSIRSVGYGLSGDGSTVVGDSTVGPGDQHAYRWRRETGMVDLGQGIASAVSHDGSVVVGIGGGTFRWTEADGMQIIGSGRLIYGFGTTPDGSVIVGTRGEVPGAFRWTAATGMVPLGSFGPGLDSFASAVSDDGSVVVGSSNSASFGGEQRAFRWTAAGGLVDLGVLGRGDSVATDVSGDGSVIVGYSGSQAFRWTSAEGMVGLGDLPGGRFSGATAISRDGSTVIGTSETTTGWKMFIWDATNGMRNLESFFIGHGLNMDGWTLRSAYGISDDLSTFAGSGINPQGNEEAWIASIRESPPGDFNSDGTVDAADYVVWRKGLGTTYTQNAYNVWRAHFGQSAASSSAINNAVPEPDMVAVVLVGMLSMLTRPRRELRLLQPHYSPTGAHIIYNRGAPVR